MAIAATGGVTIAPAVISAGAALAGVGLAQIITGTQRRRDNRDRRRSEVASVIAMTLSLIIQALEQVERGAQSETAWRAEPEWVRLRAEQWPPLRMLLLTKAFQERRATPALYGLALRLQELLVAELDEPSFARDAWEAVQRETDSIRMDLLEGGRGVRKAIERP